MNSLKVPKDGLSGLIENFKADSLSGFMVFLLALPLSLGIAKASGFSASQGVLTAMIGGLLVGLFQGGRLTIKGPAAGLITVCAGAVAEMGDLHLGNIPAVDLVCGAIVVMAVIQLVLSLLKLGFYSDFFPLSVVHGMLAAIGLIIFAKQVPVLLGIQASHLKGLSPFQLYEHIPDFIIHLDPKIAVIGVLSLLILFGMPMLGGIFKKIPAPMIVLLVTIPLGIFWEIKSIPDSLVVIGNFWQNVNIHANFSAIGAFVFWKYVIMFLFVNSLESLLTVKAIDGLDPWRRPSDYNKDLGALSAGNGLAGLLGGLPMISEVARSSANVGFGGRTSWANVFHGLFIFLSMLLIIPMIELIPNAALAAMLIAVAYRLASPKEFIGAYKIGNEQLVIFLVTIVVTVGEDLLLGVFCGIVTKIIFHIKNGATLKMLFKSDYALEETSETYKVKVNGVATFSNFLGYKKLFKKFAPGKQIEFDFSHAKLVDHSFMDQIHHFEEKYEHAGGNVTVSGLDSFFAFSDHPLAARKPQNGSNRIQIRLSSRQTELSRYAKENEMAFYPQKVKPGAKYKDFPLQMFNRILSEENLITGYEDWGQVAFSDLQVSRATASSIEQGMMTVLYISEIEMRLPDFTLTPEKFSTRMAEFVGNKDIDFESHPLFSSAYYLRGADEAAIRDFFTPEILAFFESHEALSMECHRHRIVIYDGHRLSEASELDRIYKFASEFAQLLKATLVNNFNL
ncbi:MAG: sulfate transporter [Candidatus Nephrothrix sp. EaCA]|nr:MAG: sulfate transporter [Candidatus Nephrothrix sp. EaCA]